MKQESRSYVSGRGLTLGEIANVLKEEVRVVFGDSPLTEKIHDHLLAHFLCFHVSNVRVVNGSDCQHAETRVRHMSEPLHTTLAGKE